MEISTFLRRGGVYFVFFTALLFFTQNNYAQSVPVYATTISNQDHVDFSGNSIDGNLSTRARVRASSGIALGIGDYNGFLELQFPSELPANTTSFVKIQTDDNLLPALLGGSLGGLLADVLGGVLIGNQEFTVQAKNVTNVVLQGNSQTIGDFASSRLRIVINANNDYFIAITPSQPYNRIRITNRLGSLVGLNNTKRLDVYEAFYIGTPDPCGSASYTSFDGDGINLDALNLGSAGVSNPHFAIDANQNNFSRLSLGILAVAGSIEQTVYFDGLSQSTDQFFIRLRVDPSLLAVGAVNNIQIIASNGPNVEQMVNLSSLLNLDLLTLLQENQVAAIRFAPGVPVNRITIRYNSLLNAQLTQSLDFYGVQRAPANPTITDPFTLNPMICAGSSASLVAQTTAGTELNWYSQAVGGSILATTNSGQAFVTPPLNSDISYYVSAKRIGCPEESLRVRVRVDVTALPTAADIEISDEISACNGSVVLSPSTSLGNNSFRYYKDQAKTQEIITGYAGDAGVTYTMNNATGELSISGLSQANSPYQYYISITANGICENPAGSLKAVTVNFATALVLNVTPTIQGCGSVNLRNAILNFDNSADIQYNFFTASNNPITAEAAANIQSSGSYFIQATSLGGSCSSPVQQVVVTVNPNPTLTVANETIVVNAGSSVTLDATSNGTVVWYNSNGTALPSNSAGPFSTPGNFTFTAVATLGTCSVSRNVSITVIDPDSCPPLMQRDYANMQSWGSIVTGGVANPVNAIDGNPQTYSTIVTGIGLLGIGTTFQTLQWTETITAGTPVTLKLGSEYSGLIVAGAYSVVGTKRNGSGVPVEIGNLQPVSGSLVDLLPGQNTFEFTFVPSNSTGPKAYDGVRIVVSSLVSVAQNVRVYEAYYKKIVTQNICNSSDAEDVFYGAVDLGVGVASATVGVADEFNAVDADVNSYATMFSGAGILAAADLTIAFRTPTSTGDSLDFILSRPSTILDLNLLTGFSIQLYLGNTPIGAPIANNSTLLSLILLGGGSQARITLAPQIQSYDRIKIRFGGVASVLDILRVHDVKRKADTSVVGGGTTNTVTVCPGGSVQLSVTPDDCTTFTWYDAAVGGNVVATGTSFTLPSNLAAGNYTYYIQPIRFGCAVYERGIVNVVIGQTAPPTAIASVSINGAADTTICNESGTVTLQATLDPLATITNPVFYWYNSSGTLITGQTTSTLALTGLTPGNYTYFVGISSEEFCQTAAADRKQVSFTILPSSTTSDINAGNVSICVGNNAVITPTTSRANPQFQYFFTNNNSQPISNGTVGGVTYAIAPNGTLTISGLTAPNSPYTFYIGLTSDTTCLNQSGGFTAVTVTVSDSGTPTTTDSTQDFCLAQNPTVGDMQVNEANIVFYDAPNAGNIVANNQALVSGMTYYAAFDPSTGCSGLTRLAITVTVNDAATPTTVTSTQQFCLSDNPTISMIQVNEPNITFYSSATGGMALNPNAALVNNATYYASLTNSTNGCQSSTRLSITVNLIDVPTPSTNDSTQEFCTTANPTVADIQVNETGVQFYTTATGGTALASNTALTTGTYYASLTTGTCQSSVRLAIAVTVSNPATPTTNDSSQDFCSSDNPKVADIQVNETGVVFYADPNGGTALASNQSLSSGIYYAAIDNGVGCQSSVRLSITVTVSDPATPTTGDTTQEFCQASNPTIADIQVNQSNVIFYSAQNGGTALIPTTALANGATYYVAQIDANGCESTVRLAISVTLTTTATPTTNDTTQDFCSANNPTVADIQINESNVLVYDVATGGTALSTATALTTATYYVAFDGTSACTSGSRLAITVTVNNPGTPTTSEATQDFCASQNATVADLQVNESGVIFYNEASDGTAYASTDLLVTGNYYAALTLNGCESSSRLLISVTVNNPATPTTNNASQQFCQASNPTVAAIQVNEASVIFYNAQNGGTAYAPTDLLTNGIYYAAISLNGCESQTRLAITVTINTASTPTTNDSTQDFCLVDIPTVADIQVNENGVLFYATPNGGTALASTDFLANGIYYAAFDPASGCASGTRLAITVTVNDPGTPTTANASQQFCQANNPTVGNIQTNQFNVIFYTTATGGTGLSSGTALVAGTYYAALLDAVTGCQSTVRLPIAVTFSAGEPAVVTGDNDVCAGESAVYSANVGKTNYNWTVVGGTITSGGQSTDTTVSVSWTTVGNGSVSVSYADVCSGNNTANFTVAVSSCSDITITKTVDNPTPTIGDNVVFTITVNNTGSGAFQNLVVNDLLPSGYSFVSASATTGTYSNLNGNWNIALLAADQSATLNITVKVLANGEYLNTAFIITSDPEDSDPGNNDASATIDPICLIVYNEFSPNGDGNNDLFRIDCIQNYPGNKLEVFNRYGTLVYSKNNYNNDWDGTANASGTIGEDNKLPTGTYYYILNIGAGESPKQGWLYLIR